MSFKILALVMALFAPAGLNAQKSLGQITGSVTDNTGGVVRGAKVTAVNVDTNVSSPTVKSSDGLYNILSLIPGPYEVTI